MKRIDNYNSSVDFVFPEGSVLKNHSSPSPYKLKNLYPVSTIGSGRNNSKFRYLRNKIVNIIICILILILCCCSCGQSNCVNIIFVINISAEVPDRGNMHCQSLATINWWGLAKGFFNDMGHNTSKWKPLSFVANFPI